MTDSTTTRKRHAFTGSCHCGDIWYIAHLNFPHDPPPYPRAGEALYRCNCTICHKAGLFHVRLDSAPDDFLLLSPLDPFKNLGDYQCGQKILHFFFCRTCGVRCFTFLGEGENVDVNLDAVLGKKGEQGETGTTTVKAWRPKKDGWKDDRVKNGGYLSVNANTLDQMQDGLDIREWCEKGWMYYIEQLNPDENGAEQMSYDRPFPGGMY
ncbi:hypothetical protein GMORB2_1277 [Geosmithia morbida]|uniref:CENP-V/GFA domain-containing protein n=1 Tax=Geosmithia morbida TaxID=1094350 RepID=A0A9P5D6X3_9HYPO|nr:uncharacterized protein GMORB2_1277 [Geosmithia morbida]KAF4126031.1 hypothetical protein GMORB2_1277 [Geosmithia morbida]